MMNDAAPDRRRPLKHRIKLALRAVVARVVFHARLHRLISRLSRRGRLTILALHNVEDPPATDFLPDDMKTPQALFDRLVATLAANFPTFTVRDGVRALARGELRRPAIAISMDDGYRDNLRVGLPLLRRHGANGTVYVEAGAVGDRRLSWTHAYFWVIHRRGFDFFLERYRASSRDRDAILRLDAEAKAGGDLRYHLKRILKYHADPADRDRVCEVILREAGGDPAAICAETYLSPEEVRELDRAGVEVGTHTISHPILARCSDEEVEREILEGRRRVEAWLGHPVSTFAYPWGRRWDYDDRAV
ncbi:MAG TPA: polysaccharide deacetylase family protein, partial [Planctomycetota bacterium]|nr:polysaccharide deacetylase family protein [Planctomycetota bacterium]